MVIATVNTGHFEFLAVGVDKGDAQRALLRAWKRHRQDYTSADPGYMRECIMGGEVTWHEGVEIGGATRDGERV